MNIMMKMGDVTAGFEQLKEDLASRLRAGLEEGCLIVETEAKLRCPRSAEGGEGGGLRNSITSRVEGTGTKLKGVVGSVNDHAVYVHEGTGIHSRTGNGRKDVPWTYRDSRGNFHVTDGIEPNPFLERARNDKEDEVRAAVLRRLTGG